MKLQAPLNRVRGLGSAHEGAHAWRTQRLRAMALVPLSIWFVWSMITLVGADHAAFKTWIRGHGNALMLMLFIGTMFPHAWQGMRAILEDYVHGEPHRTILAVGLKFLMWTAGVSCVMAVARLYMGA